jgi:hypothetical protein
VLERLAAVNLLEEAGRVITLYLDLDPSKFAIAPARASEIRSLIDDVERQARELDGLSHEARLALREDIQRLRSYFELEFSADGTHGLAIFASAPARLFETVRLSRAPESSVTLDVVPSLRPLLEARPDGRWLVLLLSRSVTRLVGGSCDRLEEVADWSEYVHGRHAQGGWSQPRYERSVEEDASTHVRAVFERLGKLPWRERYDHLLIAAPAELRDHVERDPDPSARERLVAVIERDLAGVPAEKVLAEVRPAMEEHERTLEGRLLERIREGIATGGRGAGGLDEVLGALVEQRVETLLVEPRLERPGVLDPVCGWMGSSGETCPVDGNPLRRRRDIMRDALARAVQTDAGVAVLHYNAGALGPLGGLAALLRF